MDRALSEIVPVDKMDVRQRGFFVVVDVSLSYRLDKGDDNLSVIIERLRSAMEQDPDDWLITRLYIKHVGFKRRREKRYETTLEDVSEIALILHRFRDVDIPESILKFFKLYELEILNEYLSRGSAPPHLKNHLEDLCEELADKLRSGKLSLCASIMSRDPRNRNRACEMAERALTQTKSTYAYAKAANVFRNANKYERALECATLASEEAIGSCWQVLELKIALGHSIDADQFFHDVIERFPTQIRAVRPHAFVYYVSKTNKISTGLDHYQKLLEECEANFLPPKVENFYCTYLRRTIKTAELAYRIASYVLREDQQHREQVRDLVDQQLSEDCLGHCRIIVSIIDSMPEVKSRFQPARGADLYGIIFELTGCNRIRASHHLNSRSTPCKPFAHGEPRPGVWQESRRCHIRILPEREIIALSYSTKAFKKRLVFNFTRMGTSIVLSNDQNNQIIHRNIQKLMYKISFKGYVVEHKRTGSPYWVKAAPLLARHNQLSLSGLEPGMRYQFRVTAENACGRSEPSPLSEPFAISFSRGGVAVAPMFSTVLKDTTAIENEKVEFTVKVEGTPTPKISWFKDGFEVFSNRRQRVTTDGEASTLMIYQAALSDEGEVKCTATNKAGHAVTKARLSLEAPPSIRLQRQYEDGLIFELGEVIRLKVAVSGRPQPDVAWFHDGEQLTADGRIEMAVTDKHALVKIADATRLDRGEYQIGWDMWLKAATCRQLQTTIGDLIEGSEYKFRVKAENPYGVSDPSVESHTVFIPDPKRGFLEPPPKGTVRDEMDDWPQPQPGDAKGKQKKNKSAMRNKDGGEWTEDDSLPSQVVLAHQVSRI
ncbi:unnamed protein product [Nesidiocoris tenuis]|uniref:Uncharacterized protein n=1 Tax=Nesidiocoris tenuis TaxID=355587 RepID=A0A6H5GNN4_9HEMI|nr:unnamed protein product [Nesidiocoris tenuis]